MRRGALGVRPALWAGAALSATALVSLGLRVPGRPATIPTHG
ncbi:hypothetical protein OG589_01965 [Sphaerisporangium sp. NBC_01403]